MRWEHATAALKAATNEERLAHNEFVSLTHRSDRIDRRRADLGALHGAHRELFPADPPAPAVDPAPAEAAAELPPPSAKPAKPSRPRAKLRVS